MQTDFQNNAVFWIETGKISPNPFQPRREFDQEKLNDLAESIRAYGVLQPLVVTRKETVRDDGGIGVEYELLAGERRLRASKIVGLPQVPVLIRSGANNDREKLEISIIENLQREDLNPVERARAFKRLAEEFGFKHHEIGVRVGKSRVYVTNTLRMLDLPEIMINALSAGEINEGHTRPLLMLIDRPEEQKTLFEEIKLRKLTVREVELEARKIAVERARKRDLKPELLDIEKKLREKLGTRVSIEPRGQGDGGKVHIDFFSPEDLLVLLSGFQKIEKKQADAPIESKIEDSIEAPDEELYSVRNFSI